MHLVFILIKVVVKMWIHFIQNKLNIGINKYNEIFKGIEEKKAYRTLHFRSFQVCDFFC